MGFRIAEFETNLNILIRLHSNCSRGPDQMWKLLNSIGEVLMRYQYLYPDLVVPPAMSDVNEMYLDFLTKFTTDKRNPLHLGDHEVHGNRGAQYSITSERKRLSQLMGWDGIEGHQTRAEKPSEHTK